MIGLVLKATGSLNLVKLPDGKKVMCGIRGQLRLKDKKTTNPVAVGDLVEIQHDTENDHYNICEVHNRKNYIIRKSIKLSKKYHVIASNIDQALLMITLHNPRTPYGFIDRMLVTCEAYNISAILLVNKKDTWNQEDFDLFSQMEHTYSYAGYQVKAMSCFNIDDVEAVRNMVRLKTSLIMGHSGTGKSTLLNVLNPGLDLKTGDLSEVHLQGKHTTSFPEMHEVAEDSWVVDTPGLREFGITDMQKSEISHYFPEIFRLGRNCKFSDCRHQQEPGCAVTDAVEKEIIPFTRYRSYCAILDGETPDPFD